MTDSRVFKGYCSYLCEYCFSNESSKCLYIDHETFSENAGLVKPQWYIFKKVKVNAEYDETEASSLVKSSDIAVTWTGDDLTYNLVKLENDLFLTEGNTKDDYGQTFFSMTKVIGGHYYKRFIQVKEDRQNKNSYGFQFQCCRCLPRIVENWTKEKETGGN